MNHKALQELARSTYWQLLYSRSKEMNLKLFQNDYDFTNLQIWMLYYLALYASLYEDIALDKDFISEKHLDSWNRVEAYLMWKKKNQNKKEEPNKPANTGGLPIWKHREKK